MDIPKIAEVAKPKLREKLNDLGGERLKRDKGKISEKYNHFKDKAGNFKDKVKDGTAETLRVGRAAMTKEGASAINEAAWGKVDQATEAVHGKMDQMKEKFSQKIEQVQEKLKTKIEQFREEKERKKQERIDRFHEKLSDWWGSKGAYPREVRVIIHVFEAPDYAESSEEDDDPVEGFLMMLRNIRIGRRRASHGEGSVTEIPISHVDKEPQSIPVENAPEAVSKDEETVSVTDDRMEYDYSGETAEGQAEDGENKENQESDEMRGLREKVEKLEERLRILERGQEKKDNTEPERRAA